MADMHRCRLPFDHAWPRRQQQQRREDSARGALPAPPRTAEDDPTHPTYPTHPAATGCLSGCLSGCWGGLRGSATVAARRRAGGGAGECCQGCGGAASHTKSLHYSYDFAVPVGTPVLAAHGGIVTAACDAFRGGGLTVEFRARANYVILRHGDLGCYSRYYHLQPESVRVRVGERVKAGAVLGRSGLTGYTSGPHLHFDLVDFCIFSYVRVAVCCSDAEKEKEEEKNSAAVATVSAAASSPSSSPSSSSSSSSRPSTSSSSCSWHELYACVASFSGPIPSGTDPLSGRLMWADPATASCNPLRNAEDLQGTVVIVARCGQTDFLDKALRAEDAGAAAVIIVNNEDGPALHVCARPKNRPTQALRIPVVMVTKDDGAQMLQNIAGNVCAISERRGFLPPPPPNDVVDDARANTPPFHVGAGEDTAPFALRTSPLREKWQEFSAEKPFSEFEPVTVGRVCFFVPPDDAGATAIEWPDPKAGEKVPFRY